MNLSYNTIGFILGFALGGALIMAIFLILNQFYMLGIFGLICSILGAICLLIQSAKLDKAAKDVK